MVELPVSIAVSTTCQLLGIYIELGVGPLLASYEPRSQSDPEQLKVVRLSCLFPQLYRQLASFSVCILVRESRTTAGIL